MNHLNGISGWLAGFLLVLLMLGQSSYAAEVRDVRFAQHPEYTRMVVELSSKARYRLSNLSDKHNTMVLELYGVEEAPEKAVLTGEEEFVFSPQTKFDKERRWYSLHVKTKGPVRAVDYTLKSPLRIVVDVYQKEKSSDPTPDKGGGSFTSPFVSGGDKSGSESSSPKRQRTAAKVEPPRRRTVILDPGHGGYHKGGWGTLNGRKVWEKDVTIRVALKAERHFQRDPRFQVKLTRRKDVYVGLRERTQMASKMNGDLFISLHCNAVEGAARQRAHGFEIWTWNRQGSQSAAAKAVEKMENEDPGISNQNNQIVTAMMLDALESQALHSRRFAKAVHESFTRESYFRNNDRGTDSARFVVLEVYDMPSILLEMGFISHPQEVKKLFNDRFQELLARKVYEGVVNYYETNDPSFPRSKLAGNVGGAGN